jgi:hypothetical protein
MADPDLVVSVERISAGLAHKLAADELDRRWKRYGRLYIKL